MAIVEELESSLIVCITTKRREDAYAVHAITQMHSFVPKVGGHSVTEHNGLAEDYNMTTRIWLEDPVEFMELSSIEPRLSSMEYPPYVVVCI